jgi:tRNA modification GTPase
VAVIVVDGVDAAQIASGCFRPAQGAALASRSVNRIVFGRWGMGDEAGEEVVACRRSATRVEIHCHGGTAAAARILDDLAARGVRIVDARTWRLETADDPIAAEADLALAQATTERAARVLLDQRQGALRSAVEAAIEFIAAGDRERATAAIATLLDRWRIGRRLVEPWQVVLAGRPNVGKSSLINRLLGYERAIVFDQPGTTRDVVTAVTAFDGWPCELSDTAGLRDSGDMLERAGVERALAALERADLVVLVDDATRDDFAMSRGDAGSERLGDLVRQLSPRCFVPLSLESRSVPVVRVLNKCDLAPVNSETAPAGEGDSGPIRTSAKTGDGIAQLAATIVARLVPHPPQNGQAVPFTRRQVDMLESAAAALAEGRLEAATASLGQITAGDLDG